MSAPENSSESEAMRRNKPILSHVNLMTDTLIANASIHDLRAMIRTLLATGPASISASFTEAARKRLLQQRESRADTSKIFANGNEGTVPTSSLSDLLAYIRCLYGSGMGLVSIEILTSVILATSGRRWSAGGKMAEALAIIDADISQAIQSCREELLLNPVLVPSAQLQIKNILGAISNCRKEVEDWGGEFPLERGHANADNLRCENDQQIGMKP